MTQVALHCRGPITAVTGFRTIDLVRSLFRSLLYTQKSAPYHTGILPVRFHANHDVADDGGGIVLELYRFSLTGTPRPGSTPIAVIADHNAASGQAVHVKFLNMVGGAVIHRKAHGLIEIAIVKPPVPSD